MSRFFHLTVQPLGYFSQSPIMRKCLLAVVLMLIGGVSAWGVMAGCSWGVHKADAVLAQTLDRRLKDVSIAGGNALDVSEILERHNVQVGALTSDIDWKAAQRDLARNPLLVNARIVRIAPDKVRVTLDARHPIARIDAAMPDTETVLVDAAGHKIRVSGQASDKSLITLSGQGAFPRVDEFWQLLTAEPAVFQSVKEARFIGQRRWDLTLKSGLKVQLPQEDMGLALSRLAELLGSGKIDPETTASIDLRTTDRLFLRTKPESVSNVQTSRQG